jgi:2-polyprenyl-3-methyl-5-hydroxy-6-metoxy-1,4-benzoquinol methylase
MERPIPTTDEQRQFWNWHWQHWKERKTSNDWTERRGELMLHLIRSLPLSNPKLLDLGCGRGSYTERLAEIGEATGIDLSSDAIASARERNPTICYIAGDVYQAELPANHFDVVVSQEVIAHVEDQPRYVQRAAAVTKPGGYFIISTGNKFVMNRLGEINWTVQPPQHIARQLSRKDLRRLLKPYFDVRHERTIIPMGHGGILRLVNSPRLNAAIGSVIPQDYRDSLKEWAGLGYQLIVLAQKRS